MTISHSDTVTLPASCVGADDGYQWMKMLDGDEYPAVHQLCDNEYMVIDINEDSNIIDYFASYAVWHSALGGIYPIYCPLSVHCLDLLQRCNFDVKV